MNGLVSNNPKDKKISSLLWHRFKTFNQVIDSRFEDVNKETWKKTVYRDFSAGLVVALTAIPMAMGFAMAMGLRPEQGIVAGALACLVGRTWGGSKYQVYGPTAAFIPVIAALMLKYGHPHNGGSMAIAHGFLVTCSLIAGVILMVMGLFGLGKYVKAVPNSIVVGFTVGIAVVIALTNVGDLLGLQHQLHGEFLEKMALVAAHINEFNGYAFFLALLTFGLTHVLQRTSPRVPAPLVSIVLCTVLAQTLFSTKGILSVGERYGSIPSNLFVFTPPLLPPMSPSVLIDACYFVAAIVFVSAIESLLCSSMADKLANNKKTPFNPDKEFWGQGLVQALVPLVNGFPCTGALARTATSIKAGAVSPLAGYFKGFLKIGLAVFLAPWLEMIPMACIAGILLWVSTNMVKVHEVKEVLRGSRSHALLLVFTAVMVPLTDFLTGVLSAMVLFGVGKLLSIKKTVPRATAGEVAHLLDELGNVERQIEQHEAEKYLEQTDNRKQEIRNFCESLESALVHHGTNHMIQVRTGSQSELETSTINDADQCAGTKGQILLVPIKGTEQGKLACEFLKNSSYGEVAAIHLFHTVKSRLAYGSSFSAVEVVTTANDQEDRREASQTHLRSLAQSLEASLPNTCISYNTVVHDSVTSAIEEEATAIGSTMIFFVTEPHTKRHWLIPGVSQRVLGTSKCSVQIMRPDRNSNLSNIPASVSEQAS